MQSALDAPIPSVLAPAGSTARGVGNTPVGRLAMKTSRAVPALNSRVPQDSLARHQTPAALHMDAIRGASVMQDGNGTRRESPRTSAASREWHSWIARGGMVFQSCRSTRGPRHAGFQASEPSIAFWRPRETPVLFSFKKIPWWHSDSWFADGPTFPPPNWVSSKEVRGSRDRRNVPVGRSRAPLAKVRAR